MRHLLFLSLFLFAPWSGIFASDSTMPYDPEAIVNLKLDGTVKDGYRIEVRNDPKTPWILFKTPGKKPQIIASYHWKQQYWMKVTKGFMPSRIDLTQYFISVRLNRMELNRRKFPHIKLIPLPTPHAVENTNTNHQSPESTITHAE